MNKIKVRVNRTKSCPAFLDRIVCHVFPKHSTRAAGTGLLDLNKATGPQEISETVLIKVVKKVLIKMG